MPAEKRVDENGGDGDLRENSAERSGGEEDHDEDGSLSQSESWSSSKGDPDELISVRLSDIRKEVQCPICLGIIKKTRTVMECLHRFCRECIGKSMRLGNKECPACRTHCASRRSLRDDPNYDALIAALYPNIDPYEEEDKARKRQIQSSIAQTLKRQSEALRKKRRRSIGKPRRRQNYQSDDDDDDANVNDGKDSSSADERSTGFALRRPEKRRRGQPLSTDGSRDAAGDENDSVLNKESGIGYGALIGSSEMLVWGRGGMRSRNRYGSGGGGNGKHHKAS